MAGLDPTIPLGATPPQPGGLAGALGTYGDLLKTQAASQQLNANRAISAAYQQSVDPQTGQVDFNKLQALASQNGAGAFLPQFMGQIAQQRNSQLQYDTGKLELAMKQQQGIRGMIGSLAVDPKLGHADMSGQIMNQISSAVQNGLLPIDQAMNEVQNIPKDPQGQHDWVLNHLVNSLSGEAKINALRKNTNFINTGGVTNAVSTDQFGGAPVVTGVLQNTLSPEGASANVEITNPDGSKSIITKAQQLQMQGGGQGGSPGVGQPGYTGRLNGGGIGLPSALSPADQSAQSAMGASANQAAQTLHDAAADAPMRLNLLQTARDSLAGINTGPGSGWRNDAKSFINALSPGVAKAIGWTGDVQNYDEFKKILTNYASSVSGSLGTGTDARLNAAVTGNANPGISNLANEDILTKTIAAEKMRQAQDYAFQQSGVPTSKFNQWQAQWNKTVNPDAFVFSAMTPTQRSDFITRQKAAGTFEKFKQDLFTAKPLLEGQ